MKKRIIRAVLTAAMTFMLCPATAFAVEKVTINETTFPDANFRSYVSENIDKDGSGVLSVTEIKDVGRIYCPEMDIENLKGIEYFVNLEILICWENKITSLDISANKALEELYINHNEFTELDVTANTNLRELNCAYNKLTSLDVSKNPNLELIYCEKNALTELDVSNNTKLGRLTCEENQLNSLDVSKNTALYRLYCYENNLTSLDVSKNTALEDLDCENNDLGTLDVTKNSKLTRLSCSLNGLSDLDLSKNTKLQKLYCAGNSLTTLDVSKNTALTWLSCSSNPLTGLDVSKNTALVNLLCATNKLDSLDLTKNTKLEYLWCNYSEIKSIDISKCTKLRTLFCTGNAISTLDVSNNVALEGLYCEENGMKELILGKNTKLDVLCCYNNALTSLDVTKCTALTRLECEYNKLTVLDVSKNTSLNRLRCNNNQLTNLDLSNTKLVGVFSDNNKYKVKPDSEGRIYFSSLAGGFDISKASNWVGGTLERPIYITGAEIANPVGGATFIPTVYLQVEEGAKKVTYDYDCGNDIVRNFQLTILPYKVTDIFTDVEDTWYVPYIQYVYDNGLMVGVDETTFAPNRPLTRAMFVQILYTQAGEPEVSTSSPFTDLTADWYKNAVTWAYANGIVSGKSETTFGPDDNITREQLAVMLYSYAGSPEISEAALDFPDTKAISDYAVKAITWAVQNGIMSGKDANGTLYLEPKGQATRAEAATMVMQYLEIYLDDGMEDWW